MGAALPSPSSSILPFTLLLSLLVLLSHVPCSASFKPQVVLRASGVGGQDQPQPSAASAAGGNKTGVDHKAKCLIEVVCKPGVLLPVWLPLNPPMGEQAGRAIIYFACLLYMFLGVSIIADRFMGSIEVITSQEKEVKITQPNGEVTVTTVRIWNETVSNLTLMALGSSAPEILLSVIEVIGHNFHAGELGPGTIVGSAAFNMFVIIGLCVWVIPNGETRKIKHLRVFIITAFWSIFAYIWLYLILAVISPEVVEVWEAIVTLVYFPVCVLLAWIADRRLLFYKYTHKRYRADKRHGIVVEMEGDHTSSKGVDGVMDGKCSDSNNACAGNSTDDQANPDKDEVVRILKDQKEKHPDADLDQLIEMANYSALVHQKKSRAFYRVQATRLMIGAGNVLRKHAAARRAAANSDKANEDDMATCSHISFEKAQYQCTENCGTLTLAVVCLGGTGENTFYVDYRTENGSANAGADYELVEGTLVFKPGEVQKEIKVSIVDDDVFEEDEHFFVRLQNLRLDEAGKDTGTGSPPVGRLVDPVQTTVTILDDDHAGIFTFRQKLMRVSESTGVMVVTVARNSGSRGVVTVPYHTEDGTARAGLDYDESRGELEFSNEQTSQTLQVRVINVAEYEKQENFFVVLEDPKWLKRGISGNPTPEEEDARRISEMGKPILGEHSRLEVVILESYEFKSTVDTLLKDANLGSVIGSNSWKEQFIEAVTVSAGGDDEEGQEQRKPNCGDYLLHIISVFWKILFAFVPPTSICNGWACFVVSICVIGFLTAIIGDLASHFGCTVGLRDTVTAVVFVALGTSIPDTFASKVAATQDDTADASVGNVTGSNAVNVFLGIGVAWSVAAVYWEIKGEVFRVDPGSLAFSVTLFTIFAFIVIFVLMFRRKKSIGGELGGPKVARVLTTLFFVGLWFLYILFSSLEAYCHVQGF